MMSNVSANVFSENNGKFKSIILPFIIEKAPNSKNIAYEKKGHWTEK